MTTDTTEPVDLVLEQSHAPPLAVDAPSYTVFPNAPDAHPGVTTLISLLTGAILRGGRSPRIVDRRVGVRGTLCYMPREGKVPPPCAYELLPPAPATDTEHPGAMLTVPAGLVDVAAMVLEAGRGHALGRGGDISLGNVLVIRGGDRCVDGPTNPYDCVARVNGVPVIEEPRPEPSAGAEGSGAVLAETLEPPPFEGSEG